jgi:hypothetical protein
MEILIEIMGWLGSAIVLWAYVMVSSDIVKFNKKIYQTLNLIGSIFLIVNTVFHKAYPSAFVNSIWVFIAIFALIKLRQSNKQFAITKEPEKGSA